MNEKRIRSLNEIDTRGRGPVVYWMSRDQRARDNWALLHAQELAAEDKKPVAVIFCLVPEFLGAAIRQYRFVIEGLKQVEQELLKKNIPFYLLLGKPGEQVSKFVRESETSLLVTDFDPLRIKKKWKEEVKRKIKVPFIEVDTHNIVPCWAASPKQEFAAYTIRNKIKRQLPEFLTDFSRLKSQNSAIKVPDNDWQKVEKNLKVDFSVPELKWVKPGEKEARNALKRFIARKLSRYPDERNDPNKDAVSDLSPYLHFGQIAAQRVALEVRKTGMKARDDFLEELIIRRELADNYCFYNQNYDSFQGLPEWAQKTLDEHRQDQREYLYALKRFESAQTHDDLWNAAQLEMVKRGKMHGYLRMYWAKKILEWTRSPEEAQKIALYLNDKYELDGRDPNGYVGVAWSIGGVHDRAWPSRPVFGKIRYMSYNGCRSKFNVPAYIDKIRRLS